MTRKSSAPSRGGAVVGAIDFPFGANAEAGKPAEPAPAEPAPGEPVPASKPANPFSREALRLNQSFAAALGLEKHTHNIPVDKPPAECWFRVRDDEDFVFDTYLLHIKNGPDRGVYQVSADLLPALAGERMLKPTPWPTDSGQTPRWAGSCSGCTARRTRTTGAGRKPPSVTRCCTAT